MADVLGYAPIAATVFAVPQFVPQLRSLLVTTDVAGVSWSWAVLTSVNNAAWMLYFALARYWSALIPSASVTILAGAVAVVLTHRGQARPGPAVLSGAWTAAAGAAFGLAGNAGLGTVLVAGFVVQVTPSVWSAFRVACPTGVSPGTWLLILAELACWLAYGLHESDPRLIALGAAGVAASALMLGRIYQARPRTAHAERVPAVRLHATQTPATQTPAMRALATRANEPDDPVSPGCGNRRPA